MIKVIFKSGSVAKIGKNIQTAALMAERIERRKIKRGDNQYV